MDRRRSPPSWTTGTARQGRGRAPVPRLSPAPSTVLPPGVCSGSIRDLREEAGLRNRAVLREPCRPQGGVDRGEPAIIFVDYGALLYEANHFMVVTGYTQDGVIVNSGHRENQPITKGELEKIWKRNGYWTLVVKPSG